MKKATLGFLLLILFSSFFSSAFALGISPSRTELDYEPGLVKEITYTILGVPGSEIEVVKQNELSKYVEVLSPENFTLNEKGTGSISVRFTVPELQEPGLHEALVGAQEGIPVGLGDVVARVAVLAQIWVRIPYPEKYLDFWFEAPKQVATNSIMPFTVKMISRGSVMIERVTGVVEIFDSLGNSIAILPTTSATNLGFGQSATISADWSTANVKAGAYRTIVTVNYDEKTKQFEHDFSVGEMLIEIVNVNASQILKDSIAKIPMTVVSKWNDKIDGVYATIDITYVGRHITQLQTPTKTVNPWSSEKLEAYWDTTGLELGAYAADITVYYAGKTASTKKQLRIVETLEERFAISADAMIIGILILIVMALAFAYMRKRKQPKQGFYYNYR